ncbi:MAG: AI-2E family transporter [Actinomycetota bacterium]|nr:AI-2E family transporter [Actinomycetota bacterium]
MAEPKESVVAHYARGTLGVVVVLAAVAAAWTARQVLVLVLIALVLAVGFDPAVQWVSRRLNVGRGVAVSVIMLGALLFLVVFLALVIPPIVTEVRGLVQDLPQYAGKLQQSRGWLGDIVRRFGVPQRLDELSKNAPQIASSTFPTVLTFIQRVTGGIFNFLTIVVLTIYFMGSMPRLKDGVASLFPAEDRERHRTVLEEATGRIGGYVSGNVTISIIAGVLSFIAFLIIGVPFPAALAMWVAITDLIPSVGALIGAVVCTAVAAFNGFGSALLTAGYLLVYQQVENYAISPRIMKKAVDLSPAAVVVSVLIGGSLLGFVGALLALPLAAAAKVAIRDLWLGSRIDKVKESRKPEPPRTRKRPRAEAKGKGTGRGRKKSQQGKSDEG